MSLLWYRFVTLRNILYIWKLSEEVVYKKVQYNGTQRKVCECPA
jgi:hypothetical protein